MNSLFIFLTVYVTFLSATSRQHEKAKKFSEYVKSESFKMLKGVDLFIENQTTTLNKTIHTSGSLSFNEQHVDHYSNLMFKSLCCKYSDQFIQLIALFEMLLEKCKTMADKFSECVSSLKPFAKKKFLLDILVNIYSYSENFDVQVDRNLANAVMYLYMNSDKIYTCSKELNKNQMAIDDLIRSIKTVHARLKNMIETYTIAWCSPPVFDNDLVRKSVISRGKDRDICIQEAMLQYEEIEITYIPKSSHKNDDNILSIFDVDKLMLEKCLELKLNTPKGKIYLRSFKVNWKFDVITLQDAYSSMKVYTFFEDVVKFQLLMFDFLRTVGLKLILLLMKLYPNTFRKRTIDSPAYNSAISAIMTFQQIGLLQPEDVSINILNSDILLDEYLKYLIDNHLTKSNVRTDVSDRLLQLLGKNFDSLTVIEVLNNYVAQITALGCYLTDVVRINNMLRDTEYEEVGFSQAMPLDNLTDVNVSYISVNCNLAFFLKKHVLMAHSILSECEYLIQEMMSGKVTVLVWVNKVKDLNKCLSDVKNTILSIRNNLAVIFETMRVILQNKLKVYPVNRNVIDSCYALLFYERKIQLLDMNAISMTGAFRKNLSLLENINSSITVLKRYHYIIINKLENFSISFCVNALRELDVRSEYISAEEIQCDYKGRMGNIENKIKLEVPSNKQAIELYMAEYVKVSIPNAGMFNVNVVLLKKFIDSVSKKHNSLSIIKYLSVELDGQQKTIIEVYELVRNTAHPKYVTWYQVVVSKSIVYVAYKKLLVILKVMYSNNIIALEGLQYVTLNQSLSEFLDIPFSEKIPMYIKKLHLMFSLNIFDTLKNLQSSIEFVIISKKLLHIGDIAPDIDDVTGITLEVAIRNFNVFVKDIYTLQPDLDYVFSFLQLWYSERTLI